MQYRRFGKTDLQVSEIGFGAWAIGGPANIGNVAIGWGPTDDNVSRQAIRTALDQGINFFDTADFYGLGHSEKLLGAELGGKKDIIIATKVGHRVSSQDQIYTDYSYQHIQASCEGSLKRLNRDYLDLYQLHTAKVSDLEDGACVRAMKDLQKAGKIRYWGVSLNTFHPEPEAEHLLQNNLSEGLQVVINILNQRALPIIKQAGNEGMGIIARMPLQFGLLTGKFDSTSTFPVGDHRSTRLPPELIQKANAALEPIWGMAEKHHVAKTAFSLSYILSYPEVSTVIPGMRTPGQVVQNVAGLLTLNKQEQRKIENLYQQMTSLRHALDEAG